MKIRKRLALLLALCMILAMVPASAFARSSDPGLYYYPGLWFNTVDVRTEYDEATEQYVDMYEEQPDPMYYAQGWGFTMDPDDSIVIKPLYYNGEKFIPVAGNDPLLQYDHDLLSLEVVDAQQNFVRVRVLDPMAIYGREKQTKIHYNVDYGTAERVSDLFFFEDLPPVGLYNANSATTDTHVNSWDYAADQTLTELYLISEDAENVISDPQINWWFSEQNPVSLTTVTEGSVYKLTLNTAALEAFTETEYEFEVEYKVHYAHMDAEDEPEQTSIRVPLLIPAYPHLYFAGGDYEQDPQTGQLTPVEAEDPWYYDGRGNSTSYGGGTIAQIVFFDGQTYNKLDLSDLTYDHDKITITENEANPAFYNITAVGFCHNEPISYQTGGKTYSIYLNAVLSDVEFFHTLPASEATYLHEWNYAEYQEVYFAVTDPEHLTITPSAIRLEPANFAEITEVTPGKVYKLSVNSETAAAYNRQWLDVRYGLHLDYTDGDGWEQTRDNEFWGITFIGSCTVIQDGDTEAAVSPAIADENKTAAQDVAASVANVNGSEETLAAAAEFEAAEYTPQIADKMADANIDTSGAAITLVPEVYYETLATVYSEDEIALDITPKVNVYATVADIENEDGWKDDDEKTVTIASGESVTVSGTVQVSLELPASFVGEATTVYVKHVKANGQTFYYTAAVSDGDTAETKTITFTNPNGFSTFSFTLQSQQPAPVVIVSDTSSEPAATTPAAIFTDVADTAWYHDAVYYAREKGYFYGITETEFAPANTMNRAMFAAVLYRVAGSPETTATATFPDVSADAYYAKAIAWAKENGIINGYPDGSFDPTGAVSREQMAFMLWLYKGKPAATGDLSGFTDAGQAGGYATEALKWAVGAGILNGKGGGVLDPKGNATRAEVATLLMLFDQKVQ